MKENKKAKIKEQSESLILIEYRRFAFFPDIIFINKIVNLYLETRKSMKDNKNKKIEVKNQEEENYMVTGMCLGMSYSLAFSTAIGSITNNMDVCMEFGISIGLCLGMVIGLMIKKDNKKNKK